MKLLSEFSRRDKSKSGLQSYCIDCNREYRREHYQENKQQYREYNAQRQEQRRWARAVSTQAINAEYPPVAPTPCEGCGAYEDPVTGKALEAHHDSYQRPLMLRWLCRTCHAAFHWADRRRTDLEKLAWRAARWGDAWHEDPQKQLVRFNAWLYRKRKDEGR